MSRRQHQIAVDMIDSRFALLQAGETSAVVHAEASMAVELAYSLGAIDMDEHRHYVERRDRIYARQAEAFIADIRRCAP
ncbi:hypothetical protein NIM88_04010 [Pseudomonas sp. GBPI_506]|uniref:hypothetical protein n=1 Tax=Pseudomonas sp. GBPI_506 TaxID=1735795 RepID=UPI0020CD740B|nr:hypothetical protein [Pseudomonas sp. GBPI_506]MCP9731552.1 hypothetical protein [Pseudomonas sp. GBPI_506]